MKKFTEQDIKKCGLEILEAVHSFCVKNNLKYILFYGTLLGAVRHKGYIPWDDDIDIAMPRDDYEQFVKKFDLENYGVKHCNNDKNYYLPWAKAYDKRTIKFEPVPVSKEFEIGFNIDVFPIDLFSSPENYWKIKKKEFSLLRKFKFCQFNISKIKSIKDMLKKIIMFFYRDKANYYSKRIEYFFVKKDKPKVKKVLVSNSVFTDVKTRKFVYPLDMFDNRILHEFENRKYYCPSCYSEVLTTCFGDYMVLPPLDKQVSHHSFDAFYK